MQKIKVNPSGVAKLLCDFKPHKVSGPDSITTFILKVAADEISSVLYSYKIFQTPLDTGEVPSVWKRTQTPTFWPLMTPRHTPWAKFLHYCILLFITFDLIYNMTTFVQNGFGPFGATPSGPAPSGYIKIPNLFVQSSSTGLLPVNIRESSLNGLGAKMWHYRRTNGRTDEGSSISPLVLRKARRYVCLLKKCE